LPVRPPDWTMLIVLVVLIFLLVLAFSVIAVGIFFSSL
jgi:hypothetical protein